MWSPSLVNKDVGMMMLPYSSMLFVWYVNGMYQLWPSFCHIWLMMLKSGVLCAKFILKGKMLFVNMGVGYRVNSHHIYHPFRLVHILSNSEWSVSLYGIPHPIYTYNITLLKVTIIIFVFIIKTHFMKLIKVSFNYWL